MSFRKNQNQLKIYKSEYLNTIPVQRAFFPVQQNLKEQLSNFDEIYALKTNPT
jgi:hypothetical protein